MASYHKRLEKDLEGAAASGIITPEQAGKILEHSRATSLLGGMKAAHWIAAAAGIFISLGVILVVASNWDKLGAELKIGVFLLLFVGVAETSTYKEENSAVSAPLELLWFFMPVIGIGLYAQIFNLSGDPVKPYLLWAVLSAPLAFLARRNTAAYLLTILLFAVLYYGTLTPESMLSLTLARNQEANQPATPWAHWALALAVLAGAAFTHFVKSPDRGRGLPLGAALTWVIIMLVAETAILLRTPAMLLLAGMSAAVLWLAWDSGAEALESKLPLLVWTGAVYTMTFFWHYRPDIENFRGTDSPAGTLIAWTLFAAALASLYLRRQRIIPEGEKEDLLGKGLLAASILCAFLLFDTSRESAKLLAVIANLILITLGVSLIMGGTRTSSEKTINRGVAVLTLTAVTRFIDIFGGLLTSGLAFIGTGLAFAALSYGINQGRKALIDSVKK
ncbi:MAG: hypothetical protein A2285_02660 [Elusimicrobia bacterium RIFOXYA12_FULL_57_11]|nr:MAG: hypothetical protein A2285_02660 [Elusimicrobia bacterium RIFOXYA12_FULL_57_11]